MYLQAQKYIRTLTQQCIAHNVTHTYPQTHKPRQTETHTCVHTYRIARRQRSTQPCPLILTDTHKYRSRYTQAHRRHPQALICTHRHTHSHAHVATHIQTHMCASEHNLSHTVPDPGVPLSLDMVTPEASGPGLVSFHLQQQPRTGRGRLGCEGQGEVAKEIQNLSCSAPPAPALSQLSSSSPRGYK